MGGTRLEHARAPLLREARRAATQRMAPAQARLRRAAESRVSFDRGSLMPQAPRAHLPWSMIVREWTRIGIVGFGGPPAHIALLRSLVVERRRWLSEREFEDAVAASNLLPGPASTQL